MDINIAVRFSLDHQVVVLLQQLVDQRDDRAKVKELTAAVKKSTAALKDALPPSPTT